MTSDFVDVLMQRISLVEDERCRVSSFAFLLQVILLLGLIEMIPWQNFDPNLGLFETWADEIVERLAWGRWSKISVDQFDCFAAENYSAASVAVSVLIVSKTKG